MIFGWVESIKCGAHERLTHHNNTTNNNHQPPHQGGKRYTEANTIDLTFAGLALPDACERLKPHCRYIALKLPLNFNLDGLLQRVTSSLVRADDRCARKQLLVVLDTSGREHSQQHQRGEGEGGRLRYEGFRQGLYVRVAIKGVSAEFSRNFRPSLPVVVGGLLPHEMSMGLLRCRVKRHRWHRKVLKANDPLIFSIGWRRFQSMYVHSLACTLHTHARNQSPRPTRLIAHTQRPPHTHGLQPAVLDGGPERAAALPQVHAGAHALLRHLLRAALPAQHGKGSRKDGKTGPWPPNP